MLITTAEAYYLIDNEISPKGISRHFDKMARGHCRAIGKIHIDLPVDFEITGAKWCAHLFQRA